MYKGLRLKRSRQGLVIAGLVVMLGLFGSLALLAAIPFVMIEPEDAVLAGETETLADTAASAGRYIVFGTAPPVFGWPGATSTGYKNAPDYPGSLTGCASQIQSNQTYRFCNFASGLSIGTAANPVSNVTFYGCRFASNERVDANVAVYGDNITFDYSTFEPSADPEPPVSYNNGYQYGIDQRYNGRVTVDHSDFWGWGNGIQFDYSTQAKPFVVRNSWFHDARADGGIDHTDAILSNCGIQNSYMVFDHNYIVSEGNTQGLGLQTDPDSGYCGSTDAGYSFVTITNNYFSGFGYSVAIGETVPSQHVTFTGNTFGTDVKPVGGPLYSETVWSEGAGNIWRNNKWRVAPGSYYTPVSDDGKFWWPDDSVRAADYSG